MHAGRLHRSTAALPTRPACGLVTERGVPSDQRVLRRGVASSAGGDGAEGQGEGQVEAQGGAADAGRDRCARALPHEPARRRHEDDAARNAHTPAHPPRLARASQVEKFRIRADVAESDAAELRRRAAAQAQEVVSAAAELDAQADEVDDMYRYVDAQMLTSARERAAAEIALKRLQREAVAQKEDLELRLRTQREAADAVEDELRATLAERTAEAEALAEFRGVRPQMEAEIANLKARIVREAEERRLHEHQLQVCAGVEAPSPTPLLYSTILNTQLPMSTPIPTPFFHRSICGSSARTSTSRCSSASPPPRPPS